ncbi:MAG: amidophosphoribosyltransferase [Caulobacteraceae bacterium]|nr:amidophosphoribosyltransferase [Caulobacteraceae bacterium]
MRDDDGGLRPVLKPLARFGVKALDLIWPQTALDGARSGGPGLVGSAWSGITFLEEPVCDGCAAPFPFDQGRDLDGAPMRCGACMGRRRAFDRARAACLYDDASRQLVLQLKHADRTELAALFARWIRRSAAELISESDLIVPVPVHPLRLLRRRYNQTAEIARPLARLTGLPYAPGLLTRRRHTDSQGGKSADGRRRNVAAAFACPSSAGQRLAGKRILLIDDVLTTGATAEACARTLKATGAAAVHLAVVARVQEMATRPI